MIDKNNSKFVNEKDGEKSAVLYSISQKCFHIESLREYIEENIKCAMLKKDNDYRLVGLFNSDDEAHEYTEVIRYYIEFFK